jgi:hypothetical protein
MAKVGYFERTDSLLLATLAAEGVETLPIANTWDAHGKPVNHLTKGKVDVVVVTFTRSYLPGRGEHPCLSFGWTTC